MRFAACIFLLATTALGAAPELGYVVEAKGQWVDRKYGNRALGAGRLIYADSELTLTEPSQRWYLTIRLADQSSKTYDCRVASVCSGTLRLPARPDQPTGFLVFVLGLLTRDGAPPVELSSRGTELHDGVVALQGGRVDLKEVLEAAAPDRYDGAWCLEPLSQPCASPAASFPLDRRPSDAPVRAPSPPRAGLVRLLVKSPAEAWSTASEAWVIAAEEPKFSQLRAKLSGARKETSAWAGQDPNFPMLLRAYLREIAAQ